MALALVAALPVSLGAQVTASQAKGNPNAPTPRWDVFVGYSILDPKGTFYPIQPDGSVLPVSFKLEKVGMVEDAAYYFNRNVGVMVDSGQHDLFRNTGFVSTGGSNSGIFTLQGGLVYRWPGVHFTPFVHGLGGGADIDGPDHEPYTWGPVITGGGGLDWYFGCHGFGVRLFEADYEYLHANSGTSHGTLVADDFVWGDDENINAIRLSAGVVFRGASYYGPVPGCGPLPPPALACVATPSTIYPGDPVTVTATPSGLNPKETPSYTWEGVGASGSGSETTIATSGLAAGTYTVKAHMTEGTKHVQTAEAECGFTVQPFLPPTCSIPMLASIHPDQNSTFTLTATSPQNLPLQYACTSSAGSVAMDGNKATFTANGAPEGPVNINCTVKDNKGQSAVCTAAVSIVIPPVPPNPHVITLCSIDFSRDDARPTRVDNEAKACLDSDALALQQNPDDTLVIVGDAENNEGSGGNAAQRAVNTKNYLTTEKGIDPARITVVTGIDSTKGVQTYRVPPGAVYTSDIPNTTLVDEGAVKPQERKPLPVRSHATTGTAVHHHKKAAATAPAGTATPTPAAAATAPADATKKPVHHKKPAAKKKPAAPAAPPPVSNGP